MLQLFMGGMVMSAQGEEPSAASDRLFPWMLTDCSFPAPVYPMCLLQMPLLAAELAAGMSKFGWGFADCFNAFRLP